MAKYIDAEELKYALFQNVEDLYQRGWNDALRAVVNYMPAADIEPRWIPCSERLPVEGESVFLCDRGGDMTFGRLVRTDEGYKWEIYSWWNDIDDWNAWMPLPEPYKEGEEE